MPDAGDATQETAPVQQEVKMVQPQPVQQEVKMEMFAKYDLEVNYIQFLKDSGISELDFSNLEPCERAKLRREYANFVREENAAQELITAVNNQQSTTATESACADCKALMQDHPEACGVACVKLEGDFVQQCGSGTAAVNGGGGGTTAAASEGDANGEVYESDGDAHDYWPMIGEVVTIGPPGQALRVAGWLTAKRGDQVCVTHKELDKEGRDEVWLYGYKVHYNSEGPHQEQGTKEDYKGWFSRSLVTRGKSSKSKSSGAEVKESLDKRGGFGSHPMAQQLAQEL